MKELNIIAILFGAIFSYILACGRLTARDHKIDNTPFAPSYFLHFVPGIEFLAAYLPTFRSKPDIRKIAGGNAAAFYLKMLH